jgi:hypothetical protein
MKTFPTFTCSVCGFVLPASDYAIDQYGHSLCTFCWILAVDMVPDASSGRMWWTGRRVLDGRSGQLTAWQILDGEIQPRMTPVFFNGLPLRDSAYYEAERQ